MHADQCGICLQRNCSIKNSLQVYAAKHVDSEMHPQALAPEDCLRRGDLLSALCQETPGDHSEVLRDELELAHHTYRHRPAPLFAFPALLAAHRLERTQQAHAHLKQAKVVAIVRAKHGPQSLLRCKELADMGCRALELTMDSADCLATLKTLRGSLQASCLLGVGTVFTAEQVRGLSVGGIRKSWKQHTRDTITTGQKQ